MSKLFEGRNILVPRASNQAGELSTIIRNKGGNPIEIPVIKITPTKHIDDLDRRIRSLDTYDWVVFSSVNGVGGVFERIFAMGLDAEIFRSIKIGAIGPATTKALTSHGVNVALEPLKYVSESMVAEFANIGVKDNSILHFSAETTRNVLYEGLTRSGALVTQVSVYSTSTETESRSMLADVLTNNRIDIITFTSSSAVKGFLELLDGRDPLVNVIIACIGPITANTATENGLDVHVVAKVSTISGLISEILDYIRK
jgi:uroporphyrinogen-III synthase